MARLILAPDIRRRIGLIIPLLLTGLLLWQLPRWLAQPDTIAALESQPCDLNQGACQAADGTMSLEFSLSPQPLTSLQRLNASLVLSGAELKGARLALEGRDMYMGLNQTELQYNPGDGRWQGETELALCTTGSMVWRATLLLETDAGPRTASFDFEAH